MRLLKVVLFLILTCTVQIKSLAETWNEPWNEPWQKEIIKNADYFVLAKILSNDDKLGVEIEIIKYFGNQKLSGTILINGYSLLQTTSSSAKRLGSSGHGVDMDFAKDRLFYFLLTKREDGNYAIPTPTSGFALRDRNKNVIATYRHSYHIALISQVIYEKTYSEIWNYYKTSEFNKKNVMFFINEYINKEPAGFGKSEVSTFFLQHAAMESAYLLEIPIALDRLKKFVESDNFHSRVSALQLLSNINNKKTKEYLFAFINDEQNENFEKVIAIWSLSKIGGKEYKEKLLEISENLSDEKTGFGGNIMDSRVGTYFPSPKRAIEELK